MADFSYRNAAAKAGLPLSIQDCRIIAVAKACVSGLFDARGLLKSEGSVTGSSRARTRPPAMTCRKRLRWLPSRTEDHWTGRWLLWSSSYERKCAQEEAYSAIYDPGLGGPARRTQPDCARSAGAARRVKPQGDAPKARSASNLAGQLFSAACQHLRYSERSAAQSHWAQCRRAARTATTCRADQGRCARQDRGPRVRRSS
jgi:hypothetical protein